MKKDRISIYLAVLLLVLQLLTPLGSAYAADNGVLLPPSNLTYQSITPDDGKLVWSSVYGATGYNVYQITDGQLVLKGTVSTASFPLNNQVEGKYSYVVSTLSSNGESGPCAPVDVNIVYPDMAAPSTLTNTIQNGNDIVLNWGASQYAENYKVYQLQDDGTQKLLTNTPSSSRTYTITNSNEGKNSFAVSAVNSLYGESPTATLDVNVVYPVIKEPSSLSFTITNGNDINLKWAASSYTNSYKIYQVINGEEVFKTSVTTTSAKFTNMPEGDYTFKVYSSSDRFSTSANGSQINVTVSPIVMAPPSSFTYKLQNVNDIVLTWGTASYATAYKVYQVIGGEKILKGTYTGTTVTYANQPGGDYKYEIHSYSDRYGESEVGTSVNLSVNTITMAPPANPAYKIQNLNDIALSWTASAYADSYKVYQVIDDQKLLKATVTGTAVTFNNMPAGNYTYVITSYSSRFGESADSGQIQLTVDPVVMEKPADFNYQISNGNDISLTWSATSNTTNYKVYQIVNGQKTLVSSPTGTSVSFTNKAAGDYSYQVYSYNSRFGESSEWATVSFTLVWPVMLAPTNSLYNITGPTSFSLSWDTVPFATSYKVYQVVNGTKTLKATVTGTTTSFSSMAPGQYTYEVHSVSTRFGEGKDGSTVNVSLTGQALGTPAVSPVQILNGNDIKLSWNAVQYATSYRVYRVIEGLKFLQTTTTSTTVTYTNQPDGDYDYFVYSYSALLGESPDGTEQNFSLVYPEMQKPNNLVNTIQNFNDITLKWDPVQYATSYNVYEVLDGQEVFKATTTTPTIIFTKVSEGTHSYVVHSVSTRFSESADGSRLEINITFPELFSPTNVTSATANGNDITLKWTAAAYATSYNVYQVIDGQKQLKTTVTGTTVTFTNFPEGDYSYEVYTNSDRYGESAQGSPINFTVAFPVMQAPLTFTNTITNGNDITLSWGSSQYATAYNIYKVDADGNRTLVKNTTARTLSLPNMPEGDYSYEVTSYSSRFGESPVGKSLSFPLVFPIMQTPALSYSIANGNDITLKWNSATYATGYKVYQIIDGQKQLIKSQTGTILTLVNQPEGDYTYEVHSYSDRFGESPESLPLSFTLVSPIVQTPVMKYSVANGNDITLSWNAAIYANGYKLYQVIDGQKVLKQTLSGTSVTFTNMPEGDYTYEVHSYSDRFGESPESKPLAYTLVWPVMQAPAATHSILNGNDIRLSWNPVTYATGYNVYQIIDGQKQLIKSQTGTTLTYTNMSEGDYQYEIHSYSNRFGESPDSDTESFNLTWPVVQAPALQGTVINANNLTLTWNAVTWGNEYRVYEVKGETKTLLYKGTALTTKLYNLTEDTHYFQVTAYNTRFGESVPSNALEENIIFPEMQPPTASVTVTSPTSARISWDFVTYANGYNVYENIAGMPFLWVKNLNNLSFTATNLSYSNHKFYVTSYSNSFGESQPSNTVIAKLITDTEAPVTISDAATSWTGTSQTVKLTATDNDTGVAKTYYSLNDEPFVEGTTFSIVNQGVNKLSFYSIDKAGNMETVKTVNVKIDKTAPETKTDAPADWAKDNATVTLSASDNQSGIAKTYYSINGSDYTEGTSFTVDQEGVNKVSFYSVDQAGNKEDAKTIEVKVDKTAPKTKANAPTDWQKNDVTINLSATDSESGVEKTYYSVNGSDYVEGTTLLVGHEGVNQFSFYSVDQAGNIEDANTVEVKVDKTAPKTNADAPTDWQKNDVTVNLSATDSNSGVAKTYYSINGSDYVEGTTFTVDQEGVNQVSFYSVDQAGNKEDAKTVEIKVDKTSPETTSDAPTNWQKDDVTVNLSVTDSESGVAKTYYSVNGSDFTEGTSFTVDQEGLNEVSFYSVDLAGNKEDAKTVEVKVDKTAPETQSDALVSWQKDDVTVNLSGTDSESGVAKTYCSVNGSDFTEGTSFTVEQEGVNKVSFYSVDEAGNKEDVQTIEVKVDKTAPETSTDIPANWQKDDVTVNLSATDSESGVAQTYYSVNGSDYVAGNSFTVTKEGENTVSYYSVDQAGNKEGVRTAVVKVDKSLPIIESYFKDLYELGSKLDLTYSTRDMISEVEQEVVTLAGPNDPIGKVVNKSNQIILDKPGVYTLSISATDVAGNRQTLQKKFTVYIPASIEVTPNVIKVNKGVFTLRVNTPSQYSVSQFDLNTAQLSGVKALNSNNGYYNQSKQGQFKFERSDFSWKTGDQALEFRCYLNGYLVIGYGTVKVMN